MRVALELQESAKETIIYCVIKVQIKMKDVFNI